MCVRIGSVLINITAVCVEVQIPTVLEQTVIGVDLSKISSLALFEFRDIGN
jgi:hypothetical protein